MANKNQGRMSLQRNMMGYGASSGSNGTPNCNGTYGTPNCDGTLGRGYNPSMMQRQNEGGSGCGCGTKNCKALLEKLRKIDFAIVDVGLYLDSYPDCAAALKYYNKLICSRGEIREKLAGECNYPMTMYENTSETNWDWISSPWPWDIGAN